MTKFIQKLESFSSPPWTYAKFMSVALYDQDVGYYSNNRIKLGKYGDFYTSNHVHPVFSQSFAMTFLDIVEKEKLPLAICEFGAGDGSFARSTLTYIKDNSLEDVTYLIVESSSYHREILRQQLAQFPDSVKIFASMEQMLSEFTSFQGIIFSNEFLDAMPIHLIKQTRQSLYEIQVELNEDRALVEKEIICENPQILHWIDRYGPKLPEYYRTEINLEMKTWIEKIASWLHKGVIFTVDYGYENRELLFPERKDGSIRGYKQHKMVRNPLENPGEMDITSHVQWDAFRLITKEVGLTEVMHVRQDKFLVKAGLFSLLETSADGTLNPFSDQFKRNQAIQAFVHPGGISAAFQVNIQEKGLEKQLDYALNKTRFL
ncbi:class I SAM-dependent methyltransferase [Salipaludibacillus sp. CF4.18]|uniref:class I SAM-dependent methyltransferase n=1 Tax=Salipaludibacillus sp. CF4.18 TaxID=3373081 RepID=UPI003EE53CEA